MGDSSTRSSSDVSYFSLWLTGQQVVTAEDAFGATQQRIRMRPRIGELALEEGMLSRAQSAQVLEQQVTDDTQWGEIAVKHGLLTAEQVTLLLELQRARTPSLVEVLVSEYGYDFKTLTAARAEFEHWRDQYQVARPPIASISSRI